MVGNWDGSLSNATDTPGVFRDGTWYLRNANSQGPADVSFSFGNATGDEAVTGDWNGNRQTTIGVVRGFTWYLNDHNANNAHEYSFGYGNDGDQHITGDWDSNLTNTPGVAR